MQIKNKINIIYINLLLIGAGFLASCSENNSGIILYEGPIMEVEKIDAIYTDSAKIKFKLKAPKQLKYQNNDEEFPEGVYMEFFDDEQVLESTLKANYARLDSEKEIWTTRGDVVMVSIKEQRTLKTEEMFWEPEKHKIWSDVFVEIITPSQRLTGVGLTANDDFSDYEILKPVGTFEIETE